MENEQINNVENTDLTKHIIDNIRISNYTTGQRWVSLNGNFTSTELYEIADQIEKSYNKAFKNDKK